MKPLIVLLVVFGIAVFGLKLRTRRYNFPLSARIAMSTMLLFTAMGHFMFTDGMAMMIPRFIPFKAGIVYLTGIIEIVAAIGLLIERFKVITGWLLILFFVVLIPANIKAAIEQVDIEKATYTGNGLNYLWFRIPLQFFFIVWTCLSSIKR